MGILSSILGDRPSTPQTGGFTVGAEIPDELKPFYKDILGKSQALYQDSVARGFQPYTGPSLAEFTPEQQQAFTGLAGLQGGTAPVFQEAMQMTRDAAAPITTEQIEEYMNPYQQAVVDIEKREAQKQYESQVVPQLAAKAAMAQPFGGSRQAILEGMAADTQQRLLGDIQAKGSAQAYQDAVNLINNQRTASGQAAGQLATMAPNLFKTQLAEFGALQGVGEEKQKLAQQALNEAYGQYLKEQEYPYQQLGRYQSVVTGAPISTREYVPPVEQPSATNQLLGGLGTLASTYGAFGGFSPGGFMGMNKPAKTGGGIKDLPVIKRQNSGSVYENDPNFGYNIGQANIGLEQEGVNTLTNPQLIALEERRKLLERLNKERGFNLFSGIKSFFTDDERAKDISNLQDEFGFQDPNVLKSKKLKESARKEPIAIGPDGNIIYKGQRVFATPAGLSSIIQPDSKLDDIRITRKPRTDAAIARINDIPEKIINTTTKPEQDTETDPNKVLTDNKAKELKDIQEESDRLTKEQQEKKDKKDPVKTDETDVYADARAAEDAYLEALSGKEKRIQGNLDKLGIQEREAQFGNLAMLFSRLGTKTGSVLSALIESTGEVLPAALKTKNEFAKEERRLTNAVEDARLGELKTKADIKKARAKLKSSTAQQALTNALEERKVAVLEEKAETERLEALGLKLDKATKPNETLLKEVKLNMNQYMFKGDTDKIRENAPILYKTLKTLPLNSGEKELTDSQINNFISTISNDQFSQLHVFRYVDLKEREARARKTDFNRSVATKEGILDLLKKYPNDLYSGWALGYDKII